MPRSAAAAAITERRIAELRAKLTAQQSRADEALRQVCPLPYFTEGRKSAKAHLIPIFSTNGGSMAYRSFRPSECEARGEAFSVAALSILVSQKAPRVGLEPADRECDLGQHRREGRLPTS